MIARREPLAERLKRVNDLWWAENESWTYQDQISLPVVLRSIGGCDPVKIPENIRRNQWFSILPHNSDR